MKYLFLLFIVSILLFVGCNDDGDGCGSKNCSDFDTQPEAQAAFDGNPGCYGNLDRDDDGIPCESLPKGLLKKGARSIHE